MSPQIPLSVVMPAYNEEATIEAAVAEVTQEVFSRVSTAELVVVNDGSRDQTGKILDRLAENEKRLRVIHQTNAGHGAALMTGLQAGQGEYLFMIDSDRQIPLSSFARLWERAQGTDGAFGIRRSRHDPFTRLILTAIIRMTLAALFGVFIYDANVPFKIVRRRLWGEAKKLIPDGTLAPSLFLALFAKKKGYNIASMDVEHRIRMAGVSTIRHWKLLQFCSRAFKQLLAFRVRLAS